MKSKLIALAFTAVSLCAAAETPCVRTVGRVCHLAKVFKGTNIVPVATTPQFLVKWFKLMVAKDTEAMTEMALSYQVLGPLAGDGIRILYFNAAESWCEGRLTTGVYAGQHVWIASAFVQQ
jgi:hypothetical protein